MKFFKGLAFMLYLITSSAHSLVISYHAGTGIKAGFVDSIDYYQTTEQVAVNEYCYIGNPQTVCPEISNYFLSLNPANGSHEGGEVESCKIINEDPERFPDAIDVTYKVFDDTGRSLGMSKVIQICTGNGLK